MCTHIVACNELLMVTILSQSVRSLIRDTVPPYHTAAELGEAGIRESVVGPLLGTHAQSGVTRTRLYRTVKA